MPNGFIPRSSGNRAIVIGAGVSGLCAAQALVNRFEHVTVLKRDELPSDANCPARRAPGKAGVWIARGATKALEADI